jgi:hypothetical protein
MKKLFMMAALVMALIFAGCDQPTDSGNGDNTPKLTLTIKNLSSYGLCNMDWAGKTFGSPTGEWPPFLLDVGASVKQDIAEDDIGYITFLGVIGREGYELYAEIGLRTNEVVSSDRETFIFTDNTVVTGGGGPIPINTTGTLKDIMTQLGNEL